MLCVCAVVKCVFDCELFIVVHSIRMFALSGVGISACGKTAAHTTSSIDGFCSHSDAPFL